MTLEKGRSGEDRARLFLEGKGYKFICANYRTRVGELDLVMRDGDTTVFVEVKSRGSGIGLFGLPQEAVTAAKQKRIIKAALLYLKANGGLDKPSRFDVVSLLPDRAEQFKNAFEVPAGDYSA